jgi:hypothetical protein
VFQHGPSSLRHDILPSSIGWMKLNELWLFSE